MSSFFDKYKKLFEFERFVGAPSALDGSFTSSDFLERYLECCREQQNATVFRPKEVAPEVRRRMDDDRVKRRRQSPRLPVCTTEEADKKLQEEEEEESRAMKSVPVLLVPTEHANQSRASSPNCTVDQWNPAARQVINSGCIVPPMLPPTSQTSRFGAKPNALTATMAPAGSATTPREGEFWLLDPANTSCYGSGGAVGGRLRNRMEESKKIELLLGCGTSRNITGRVGTQGSAGVSSCLPCSIRRRLDAYARLNPRRQRLFALLNGEWTQWKGTN